MRELVARWFMYTMTSAAAILGSVPLMISQGAGSELRRPLGFAVVGGLIVSQVLTLYSTPVVYLYLERLRTWATGRKDSPAAFSAAE